MKIKANKSSPGALTKRLGEALAHHRSGRFEDAGRIYKSILGRWPGQPDALHFLGVLAHQRGDQTRALELIGRAIQSSPPTASMLSNFAEVLRVVDRLDEAEAACRRALVLQPAHPESHLTLALVLACAKRFDHSEASARTALQLRPDYPRASLALADALREQRRTAEAEIVYRQILAAWPDDIAAMANLGLMLVAGGDMEEGFALCRRAAELEADDLTLLNLGKAQLEYGMLDEAMETLGRALERTPNAPELSIMIGAAWAELGDRFEARHWFGRALQLDPTLVEAKIQIAELEADIDNHEQALAILDSVLQPAPDHVPALMARAKVRLSLGDVDGAVADNREAIRVRPQLSHLHAGLGHILSTAGDIDGAVASQRRAIDLNPQNSNAYAGLLTTLRHKADGSERDVALSLLKAPWMTEKRRAALNFGLAAYYDGAGQWDVASERMIAANAQRKAAEEGRHRRYDPKAYEAHVDQIIATFTPELFNRLKGKGSVSERPVFIVGMPRSGTTLTEQILASHPQVFGAGERPYAAHGLSLLPQIRGEPEADPLSCVAKAKAAELGAVAEWHLARLAALDGGRAIRAVDKMPDNYHQLGWLALLFPKARFIHCRRDLRDVALSCWITNFAEIRWANDLDHLAHRIEQYRRLMAHWGRVLPAPLLEVSYETTVADQEGQSRRLVDWIGLDWDERCLSFHQTERLVRTASVTQVRQPIYSRSVERWRRYEKMLTSLTLRLEVAGGAAVK